MCCVPPGSFCVTNPTEVPHPGDQLGLKSISGSASRTMSGLQEEKGYFYNPCAQRVQGLYFVYLDAVPFKIHLSGGGIC